MTYRAPVYQVVQLQAGPLDGWMYRVGLVNGKLPDSFEAYIPIDTPPVFVIEKKDLLPRSYQKRLVTYERYREGGPNDPPFYIYKEPT